MGCGASHKYAAPESCVDLTEQEEVHVLQRPCQAEPTKEPATSPRPALAAHKEEVLKVLDHARNHNLRHLPSRVRRALAETAVVYELQPGEILEGQVWFEGQCLVLSGQASVLLSQETEAGKTEVAVLKRGDSFGWQRHQGEMTEEELDKQETWAICQPQIVVTGGANLKYCRLIEAEC
ncbi:unnamed protein product [Effrenium voratum]|nr:unnamed protein product [Effrenium voratum]